MSLSQPKHILIVDPAYQLRGRIRLQLEKIRDVIIHEAKDGLEALDIISEMGIDLVVSNINLNKLDIWRLTRLIRSGIYPQNTETKILAVSPGYSNRIAEVATKEFEIDAFISVEHMSRLPLMAGNLINRNRDECKPSILAIEDNQDCAELITRILGKRFNITLAKDGLEGLNLWKEARHDIVLLDLQLPNMDGENVLNEIIKENPEQSVIITTAHGDEEKAARLIIKGAVDFLHKPFKAEQLRHVCRIACHRDNYIVSNDEFKTKQLALETEKKRAETTLNSIADGVITVGTDGVIDYINTTALELLGIEYNDAVNQSIEKIYQVSHEKSGIPTANIAIAAIQKGEFQKGCGTFILGAGRENRHIIQQEAGPIHNNLGFVTGAVLVFRDKTEEENIERQLKFHASHDAITGLHIRDVFEQELRFAYEETKQSGVSHTLCVLSLNKFSLINESCGHEGGDKLLNNIGQLLRKVVRAPSDIIARLAGDQFGILLKHCNIEAAENICSVILREIQKKPFSYEHLSFEISASVGISLIDHRSNDAGEITANATAACQIAKKKGKNKVAIFDKQSPEIIETRQEVVLANELMAALNEGRTELYQQEIASADKRNLSSYEILLRLRTPEGELRSPFQYLTAAERFGLTPNVDKWVINASCEWMAKNESVLENINYLSINLSGHSICDCDFIEYIVETINKFAVNPKKICFEITETAAVTNFITAQEFISNLKELGCKFSLDDFGSGMSSFAYLKNLPVNILKIDGMFIKDILNDEISLAMVKSISDISKAMGLKTVAEFVDSQEAIALLQSIGIDYLQGFEIAKPESIDQLRKLDNKLKIAV